MILRPLANFSGNGVLRGTITALDDLGEPLGFESYGNWSDRTFVEKSAKQLADATGIPLERALALLTRAVQEARRMAGIPDQPGGTGPQHPEHGLPVVEITNRQPREIEQDAWNVLQSANEPEPEFFTLGNTMVHLERGPFVPYLQALTLPALRRHLKVLADFIRVSDKGEFPVVVPKNVLEDMLAMAQPPLPSIRQVVNTPVLAPDGSILAIEGYDPQLALYLAFGEVPIPPVSDVPSQGELDQAKALLVDELLADFPFASRGDLANAVAGLLITLVRPVIDGPTPLHMIEAPTQGTGKGLLAQCIAIIATGGPVAVMTEARDDDEWRKRITAKLREAPPLVLLDNLKRKLDSGSLSSALTEPIWGDRELGSNRTIRATVTCGWFATANNPTFSGELARRIVRIRLDAAVEIPWERKGFRHDPLDAWVKEHRGDLLWALLTLAKAWVAAGRPKSQVQMGRFQSWADTIGGILKVAGIPGFLENREEVYTVGEADQGAWRAFVGAWGESYGEQRVETSQLFDLAKEKRLLTELRNGRTDQGARVSLGRAISAMRDRVVEDWTIRMAGIAHGGASAFRLERRSGSEKSSPLSPSSPPPRGTSDRDSGDNGEDGDHFSDLDQDMNHFWQAPNSFGPCTCLDTVDPPLNGDGLPVCPKCSANQFWCPMCGGCRLCIGDGR